MTSSISRLSRSVLRIAGVDALNYLQGLITVNINRLCDGRDVPREPALFGALLNNRGRVEHATFFVAGAMDERGCPSEVFLDCATDTAPELYKHMKKFRLRAKVDIDDVSAEMAVLSTLDAAASGPFFTDPRLDVLHRRALVRVDEVPADAGCGDEEYAQRRILLGVADHDDFGGQPLPLNLALHLLGAVDFDKGCYLGQELTARTHFTGVLRQRLTPLALGVTSCDVRASGMPPYELLRRDGAHLQAGMQILKENGKKAGVITSTAANCGLAVLKLQEVFGDPAADGIGTQLQTAEGEAIVAWKPHWWGDEASGSSK